MSAADNRIQEFSVWPVPSDIEEAPEGQFIDSHGANVPCLEFFVVRRDRE